MPPPPVYPAAELDRIVVPIVSTPIAAGAGIAASTFSPDIPDAARWADQHQLQATPR
jgi:hypothetical protein